MPKALELANAICANAQIAVQESKRCIRMGMQTDISTGSAFEAEAFGVCCGTEDKDEGWARSWRSALKSTSKTNNRVSRHRTSGRSGLEYDFAGST